MKCTICEERKPRRFCPGLREEICAPCCGREREESVNCPHDCEFLREARRHEKPPEHDPESAPHPEVRLNEAFLDAHQALVFALGSAILDAADEAPDTVDADIAEALGALVRTHLTLQSGLYYETHPHNPIARAVQSGVAERLAVHERERREQSLTPYREGEVLGTLVFFERALWNTANGRRKGRAFLDYLRDGFGAVRPLEKHPLIVAP